MKVSVKSKLLSITESDGVVHSSWHSYQVKHLV